MELEERLVELTEKLEQLAVTYGPDTVELAGSVLQAGAIHNLIWPGALLVLTIPLFWGAMLCVNKYNTYKAIDNEDVAEAWAVGGWVGGLGALTVGIVGGFGGLINWTNPILWKAATDPYFALAAEVLGKL